MNYLISLLELIKNKASIRGNNEIELSLQEIADIWGRRGSYEAEEGLLGLTDRKELRTEDTFREDVTSVIKKLENNKIIVFNHAFRHSDFPRIIDEKDYVGSSSEINSLLSPQDKLNLKVIGNIDSYLKRLQTNTNGDIEKRVTRTSKIRIFISQEEGIYRNEKKSKLNYPIRGKRARLISSLKETKKDGKLLSGLYTENNFSQLSKEIDQINTTFRKKIRVKNNLIVHIKTGGYKLNRENYEIKFVN